VTDLLENNRQGFNLAAVGLSVRGSSLLSRLFYQRLCFIASFSFDLLLKALAFIA
jgi:hypothetical protein